MVRNKYYSRMIPNRRNAETLVANGYEVDIICLKKKGEKSQEIINGVKVFKLPLMHRHGGILRYIFEYCVFFTLASWKLTFQYFRRRYQVIEVSGIPDFMVFTTIFSKLLGAKVVFYLLDHTPESFVDNFNVNPENIMIKLLHKVEKASAHWADQIITTQSTSKEIILNEGVPGSKITVVLNTPDEEFFKVLPSNDGKGRFSLITHGSLLKRYNVQSLIKAVPLLTQEIPELELKIVGDGVYKHQLEQLAQSLGVNKYITFTGWMPQNEVPAYIAQVDIGIVVIPAGVNPAMPNKLLEYMAMGKPAIVTTIPTIKAYFDDHSVMYYEPDNERDLARCILELYRDPQKRLALAATGLASYQKYQWKTIKHEYLNVYTKLT